MAMDHPAALFLSIAFGLVGLAYFVYGKKQVEGTFLGCGALMMIYPYFISSALAMSAIGLALCAAPFVIRRFES